MSAQKTQNTCSTKYDAQARYRIIARAIVEMAKIYAGTASRSEDVLRPPRPAIRNTNAKYSRPSGATGTPRKLPYWLVYASVQFTVALTSQTLVYEGFVSSW